MSEYNLKYLCYLDFPGTFDFKAICSNDRWSGTGFLHSKKGGLVFGVKNDLTKSNYRNHTVDGRNPANLLIGSLSHYLQGFIHGYFAKIGVPQNGWFIMENPIKMYDLGVP